VFGGIGGATWDGSTKDVGVLGTSGTGVGVYGTSSVADAIYGDLHLITSGGEAGVKGESDDTTGFGVLGKNDICHFQWTAGDQRSHIKRVDQ
jgi:hypothetical protein